MDNQNHQLIDLEKSAKIFTSIKKFNTGKKNDTPLQITKYQSVNITNQECKKDGMFSKSYICYVIQTKLN